MSTVHCPAATSLPAASHALAVRRPAVRAPTIPTPIPHSSGSRSRRSQMKPLRRFRRHHTAAPRSRGVSPTSSVGTCRRPQCPLVARGACGRAAEDPRRAATGASNNTAPARPSPAAAAAAPCPLPSPEPTKRAFQRPSFIGAVRKLPVLFGRERGGVKSIRAEWNLACPEAPPGESGVQRGRGQDGSSGYSMIGMWGSGPSRVRDVQSTHTDMGTDEQ